MVSSTRRLLLRSYTRMCAALWPRWSGAALGSDLGARLAACSQGSQTGVKSHHQDAHGRC